MFLLVGERLSSTGVLCNLVTSGGTLGCVRWIKMGYHNKRVDAFFEDSMVPSGPMYL